VERIRNAGGRIVGKTNLDEFGMGSSTEYSAYGPSLNPHDPERVPGGSSGGSAVAVASGMVDLALGSDTGGSVRQPASFCGVVGLKPTYGLVSRYGLVAYASSLDQIGPIARTVDGAALLLDVIAGPDNRDSTSIATDRESTYRNMVGREIKGVRVGLVNQMMAEGTEPEVAQAILRTADQLSADGATISEVDLPALGPTLSAYYLIATAEASSNLARYDGVRYGLRVDGETVNEMMVNTRTAGFGKEVIRRIMLGTFALSAGYQDQYYGKAQRVRTLLIRALSDAYHDVDVLLGPTSPVLPFRLGEKVEDPLAMYLTDICTVPANLAGQPAISVPVGKSQTGLPLGAQLMAAPLREDVLLKVAGAIEDRFSGLV
jgi:aspartyl-tRNA(Asn)/glutamyl-tRNA(Gln) amidotransferase subunit A